MPEQYAPWTETDLDDALGALGAELDRAAGSADLSTAADRLTRALAVPPPVPARTSRRRRYLRLALPAGIAAAVAGALLLVPSTKDSQPAPGTGETAVALRAAADESIHQRDLVLRPGQFRYVVERSYVVARSSGEHPLAWSYYFTTRTWIPYDEQRPWTQDTVSTGPVHWLIGSPAEGTRQGVRDPLHYFGAADGRASARCGDFMHVGQPQGPCVDATGFKQTTTYSLDQLPRDPQALLRILTGAGDRQPSPTIALSRANLLLRSGLVRADLRAAIYRTLALLPELRITDRLANLEGRVGIAYGVAGSPGNFRQDIVIDPVTGQYIGERTVLTDDDPGTGLRAGTVIGHSSLVTSVVSRVPR